VKGRAAWFAAGIAVAAALPVLGRAIRGDGEGRCSFNGVRIDPSREVLVLDRAGAERRFCCVDCADGWLWRTGAAPREVRVVDEVSGSAVEAGKAWFVESRVLAFPVCGSRIHVFAAEADARRHAGHFGGVVLDGDRRPLRTKESR
jgi:hypothetical protein